MLDIKNNKQALEILKTIALCGEYPAYSICMIRNNHIEYLRDMLRKLQNEGYISKVGKKQSKRFVLRQKGIDALKNIYFSAVEHYSTLMENHHGDEAHALRELRISEVRQIMTLAGIHTILSEKPMLHQLKKGTNYQPPAVENAVAKDVSYYYDSREVKHSDPDGLLKTSFTRACGLFITPANWYAIYNLRTGLTEWCSIGESKQCEMMRRVVAENNFGYHHSMYNTKASSSIIIAKDIAIANKIIAITDESRAKKYKGDVTKNRRNFIQLDGTYINVHFILFNKTGVEMLRILAVPDHDQIIKNASLNKEIQLGTRSTIVADALDSDRNFYFLFFNSDIRRLRGFRDTADMSNIPANKRIVACFPWQSPIVRECLGSDIQIITCEIEEIERVLGLEPIKFGI